MAKAATPQLSVTSKQVDTFRSGHRCDASKWMKFNGERKKWFRVNHQWVSTASIDGVSRVLDDSIPIPADGTEDRSLYDDQNSYVFNAMSQATNGGQALAIIRTREKDQNARKAYKEMKDFYERKSNMMSLETDLQKSLMNLSLNCNTPGGPLKFLSQFQNLYLDLESVSGKTVDDTKKIGTLFAAVQDP